MNNEIIIRKFKIDDAENYLKLTDIVWKDCYKHIFPEQVFIDRENALVDRINSFVDKVMRIVERNGNEVGFGSKDDIEYRIKLINRFWKLSLNNSSFEKMQLFNSYYKIVFSDYDEYQTKCYNVYSVVDGNVCIYKLIAIEINDSFYYYLDDGKEFKEYSVKELLFEFTKRNVMIKDYIEIIGINSGLDTFKLKK